MIFRIAKNTRLFVATMVLLLYAGDCLCQNYNFPITDPFTNIQHNNANAVAALRIVPKRGTILDRHHRVLASDSILYDLMVRPGKVKRQDTAIICTILKITRKEFRDRLRYALNWSDPRHPNVKTTGHPSPFKGLLTKATAAALLRALPQLQPAFSLQKHAVRHYPANTAPQLLGYVKANGVGEMGLEESYDYLLRGNTGLQFWQVDGKNVPLNRVDDGREDVVAEAGRDLYTTLDIPLQLLGEKLMKGKKGSIVAIDPQTGGILAMVSAPGYSPSELAINRNSYFPLLLRNTERPLFNRAIASYNAPGSVFKLFQALMGLKLDILDPYAIYTCKGAYTGCGNPPRPKCHTEGVHKTNLIKALAISCNSYFTDVFHNIVGPFPLSGLSLWSDTIRNFGFGALTGIDLPGEKAGIVPDTLLYNRKYKRGWNGCSIISNGIGQGEVSTTTLQLANALAVIAARGLHYPAHIVDSISGITNSGFLSQHQQTNAFPLPDSLWNIVHQGMYEAVNAKYGTAWDPKVKALEICGKTGTVENGKGEKDHSVFAAFAPRSKPRIAIVCLVENGGFGSQVAAPVVYQMIKKYLGK